MTTPTLSQKAQLAADELARVQIHLKVEHNAVDLLRTLASRSDTLERFIRKCAEHSDLRDSAVAFGELQDEARALVARVQ